MVNLFVIMSLKKSGVKKKEEVVIVGVTVGNIQEILDKLNL